MMTAIDALEPALASAWLWRLTFDAAEQSALIRRSGDAQAVHSCVCWLMGSNRGNGGYLWRWDLPARRLTVQATDAEVGRMRAVPGLHLTFAARERISSPEVGERIALRVVANATMQAAEDGCGSRGKRRSVQDPAVWLTTRLTAAGLSDVRADLVARSGATGVRMDRVLVQDRSDLCATGTVSAPAAFMDLVRRGVGKAKSYGCGLITWDASDG